MSQGVSPGFERSARCRTNVRTADPWGQAVFSPRRLLHEGPRLACRAVRRASGSSADGQHGFARGPLRDGNRNKSGHASVHTVRLAGDWCKRARAPRVRCPLAPKGTTQRVARHFNASENHMKHTYLGACAVAAGLLCSGGAGAHDESRSVRFSGAVGSQPLAVGTNVPNDVVGIAPGGRPWELRRVSVPASTFTACCAPKAKG